MDCNSRTSVSLVYEAPNSEALQNFSMEPEIVKWMLEHKRNKIGDELRRSMKLLK